MLGQMPLIVEDRVLGDLLDRVDARVALLQECQEALGVSPVGLDGAGGDVMGAQVVAKTVQVALELHACSFFPLPSAAGETPSGTV